MKAREQAQFYRRAVVGAARINTVLLVGIFVVDVGKAVWPLLAILIFFEIIMLHAAGRWRKAQDIVTSFEALKTFSASPMLARMPGSADVLRGLNELLEAVDVTMVGGTRR